ncbi:hypothetical protein [Streptococcus ferus]|uniref:hypothetical protein n=1 Tax=Streptococcus ferus TaxID=1345 RepID=UPI00235266E3|nr:hypothetical protein [Streptococcus ferus]
MKSVNLKKYLVIMSALVVILSVGFGYHRYYQRNLMKQELNLDGIFINVRGVNVKTNEANYLSDRPYDKIVIMIPSLASENDDATSDKSQNVNKVIDREDLGYGFTRWLKKVFSSDEARKYTKRIEIWYRDEKIIDETY